MTARFRQAPDVLWRSVGDEVLIAPVGRDDFDVLSGTATAVWGLLATPRAVSSLVDELAAVYEGAPESMASDVHELVAELTTRGLLEEEAATDA